MTSSTRAPATGRRGSPAARWLGVVAVAAIGTLLSVAGSRAASPSAPAVTDIAHVQAWLDSGVNVPPDAPAGGTFETGVTFWDTASHGFASVDGVRVRLLPAKGAAKPTEATIDADRTGHVVTHLKVPKGGPGTLEVFVQSGGRSVQLPISGTGPPPEAAPETLLTATFRPFVGDIVAGRAFPVAVDIGGWGEWDATTLPFPDHLVAIVGTAGQPTAATGELRQGTGNDLAYTGHLTVPDTGAATIDAEVPTADGATALIPGSTVDVTVIEAGRRDSAVPSVAAAPADAIAGRQVTDQGAPTLVVVVAIGAVVVVLIALGLRRLADA